MKKLSLQEFGFGPWQVELMSGPPRQLPEVFRRCIVKANLTIGSMSRRVGFTGGMEMLILSSILRTWRSVITN